MKYSRADWEVKLQEIMKMMNADYPNGYELIITGYGAEIRSTLTTMCFTNESIIEESKDEINRIFGRKNSYEEWWYALKKPPMSYEEWWNDVLHFDPYTFNKVIQIISKSDLMEFLAECEKRGFVSSVNGCNPIDLYSEITKDSRYDDNNEVVYIRLSPEQSGCCMNTCVAFDAEKCGISYSLNKDHILETPILYKNKRDWYLLNTLRIGRSKEDEE